MFFSTERKDKTSVQCYDCFSIGLSCLVKTFIYGQRFKKRATYLLKAFIDLKIICLGIFSMRRFFWEKFPSPPQTKIWLLTCDSYDDIIRSEKQTCGHTILK